MLKVATSIPGSGCTNLYYARGAQEVLPIRVGGASQFDLPFLTPLSVAGCGRLQLRVTNWALSINPKYLIIYPTFCGSRLSTLRLLYIEDFTLPLPPTKRTSSLWCVSAAEHHTAEQYSKTGRTKSRKHFPRSDLSWPLAMTSSRYNVFEKLLW